MAKALKYNKKDKRLLSVTFQMDKPNEFQLFRKLMEGEPFMVSGCPECGSKIPTKMKQLLPAAQVVVPDPLSNSSMFGFKFGNAHIICPSCNREIDVGTCDLTPFTDITAWLAKLQLMAKQKQKGEK